MTPLGEPQVHRRFQYTSFDENSNKEWVIKAWPLGGGRWHQRTEYCRTGYNPQVTEKNVSWGQIATLIHSKERKGYREVELVQGHIQSQYDLGCPQVTDIVTRYMGAANEYIQTYLQGTVDAISDTQIERARQVLETIGQTSRANLRLLINLSERYYRMIPTKLPPRINPGEQALALKNTLEEQEDRLQQVAAAKHKIIEVQGQPRTTRDVIGADLEWWDARDDIQPHMGPYISQVVGVFRVHIPDERQAFEDCKVNNSRYLVHGTKAQNVRHILRTGLILPRAHRGSMFGSGIYFADDPRKSMGYISGNPSTMLISEVKLGQVYVAPRDLRDLISPPIGYDSVQGAKGRTLSWGGPGKLNYSEYVVYNTAQATIRWLVVLSR